MRGTVAKRIRSYVAENYKFLPEDPVYRVLPRGTIVLAQCQRGLSQYMKRNYKRRAKK